MINCKKLAAHYRERYSGNQRYLKALEIAVGDPDYTALNPNGRSRGPASVKQITEAGYLLDGLINKYLDVFGRNESELDSVVAEFRNKYKDDQKYLKALDLASGDLCFRALAYNWKDDSELMRCKANVILGALTDLYFDDDLARVILGGSDYKVLKSEFIQKHKKPILSNCDAGILIIIGDMFLTDPDEVLDALNAAFDTVFNDPRFEAFWPKLNEGFLSDKTVNEALAVYDMLIYIHMNNSLEHFEVLKLVYHDSCYEALNLNANNQPKSAKDSNKAFVIINALINFYLEHKDGQS